MIRLPTPDDLDRLLAMVHALAAHHGDPAACTRAALERDVFGPDALLTVFITEGGYVALFPVAALHWGIRGAEMHHLFVAADRRGTGLGRALVATAVDWVRASGGSFLALGTHPENQKARDFYAALGFETFDPGARMRLKF